MTRSLAIEPGPDGIWVNSISLRPTRTPMNTMGDTPAEHLELLQDVSMEAIRGRMPLGRVGLPEVIANAALFLASDQATQITNVDLCIDGVETARNLENTPAKIQANIVAALPGDA